MSMRPPQRPNTSHAMTSVFVYRDPFRRMDHNIPIRHGFAESTERRHRALRDSQVASVAEEAEMLGFWSNRTTGLRSYRKAWLRPRSRTACFGLFAPTSAPALLAASPLSLQAHDQKFTIQATIFQLSNRTKSYAPSALTIPPYASNLDRSVRFVCIDCGKETFS